MKFFKEIVILDKPKSKWPYWIVLQMPKDVYNFVGSFEHYINKLEFKSKKINVVCQKQWSRYTDVNGREVKKERGYLYKFQSEEDRLIFIMEQQK